MLKVKNGVLTLSKEDIANIVRDAANYIIDDIENKKYEKLYYPVEIEDDNSDIYGKKNISFELDCEADKNNDDYEKFKEFRLKNNFGLSSLWNLDHTIIQFILPRLKAFKEQAHGFPGNFKTMEEWYHALDEMIWAMEWYDSEDIHDDYKKDEYGNFTKDENGNLVPTEENQRAKNGWKLFCDNFFGLWD